MVNVWFLALALCWPGAADAQLQGRAPVPAPASPAPEGEQPAASWQPLPAEAAPSGAPGADVPLAADAPGREVTAPAQEVVRAPARSPAPPVPGRPRLFGAIGFGTTFDRAGLGSVQSIPAFFASGEIGDGAISLNISVFASSASGRFGSAKSPVDRQALDAALVLPLLTPPPGRRRERIRTYQQRLTDTVALELGLGVERDGRGASSGSRLGVHTGLRADVPLTAADSASEVRLRLALRRMVGLYTPRLDDVGVGDTTELYASLVVGF